MGSHRKLVLLNTTNYNPHHLFSLINYESKYIANDLSSSLPSNCESDIIKQIIFKRDAKLKKL